MYPRLAPGPVASLDLEEGLGPRQPCVSLSVEKWTVPDLPPSSSPHVEFLTPGSFKSSSGLHRLLHPCGCPLDPPICLCDPCKPLFPPVLGFRISALAQLPAPNPSASSSCGLAPWGLPWEPAFQAGGLLQSMRPTAGLLCVPASPSPWCPQDASRGAHSMPAVSCALGLGTCLRGGVSRRWGRSLLRLAPALVYGSGLHRAPLPSDRLPARVQPGVG